MSVFPAWPLLWDWEHSSVGLEDPGPSGDGTDSGLMYPRNGDPTDLSGGCMIDFGVAPCSVAMNVVNGRAGVVTDPYEKPSIKWDPRANGISGVPCICGWVCGIWTDWGALRGEWSISKPTEFGRLCWRSISLEGMGGARSWRSAADLVPT